MNHPILVTDILIKKNDKFLFGLLTSKWRYQNIRVYGLPGGEIRYGEKISENVKRIIKEELGCYINKHSVFCVNANYHQGHYVSIGVVAEISGKPNILNKDDWEKWEWFRKDAVPENLFPSAKKVMECYSRNIFCSCE